jgi:hypothetical protein
MKRIVALIVGIALLVPSTALASGGSTCQTYNPQLCSVSNANQSRMVGSNSSASSLPFTGLDVVLLLAGGGLLLGAGLVVRRLSRDLG